MKAIMYHYVREHSDLFPNFVYLDVQDFRRQLLYFKNNFYMPSRNEFLDSLTSKKPIDNSFLLTFDDGLIDHYKYVYPILKELGMWGLFYIPSGPYENENLLDVHKIHYLLGKFDSKLIYDSLLSLVNESDFVENAHNRFSGRLYNNQESKTYTKAVKEIVNYYIKPSLKNDVLKRLFSNFVGDEKEVAKNFYLNKIQINEMAKDKMLIASHSHSHTLLSNLNYEEQEGEIRKSINFLKKCSNDAELNSFCYPYGGNKSYNKDTLKILNKNNIKYAFSVDSRDITKDDLVNSPLELPRYDCNEFPFGRAANYNV